jgi:hypothetical protein
MLFYLNRTPSPDELILVYGDTDGCVNILTFLAAREIFRLLTTVDRVKGIATVSFHRFLDSYKCDYVRWQVHREWIGKNNERKFLYFFIFFIV